MKKILSIILLAAVSISTYAQIGYQVALLNHANGEPRKNETVSVKVEITNSSNDVIYSQTQSATTNDFGLISLTIGNADTFKNVDWSKLPLYVSATVDDVLVGKTQILNVPVAEYAKKAEAAEYVKGVPTLEELIGTWKYSFEESVKSLTIKDDGTFVYSRYVGDVVTGTYYYSGAGMLCLIRDGYDYCSWSWDLVKISDTKIINVDSGDGGEFWNKVTE